VLLALVMASALSLFVRALTNADIQAQRQQAITIANDRLEQVRALPVVDLLDGRSQAAVQQLWTWDPNLVNTLSVLTYDASAAVGSTGLVPTAETLNKAKYDNVSYTVRTYVDTCYLPTSSTSCTATLLGGSKAMYRITVSVAWSPKNDRSCAPGVTKLLTGPNAGKSCQEYVVTTLRDKSDDATFNTN
jgi:hypothetical protein